jgi:hypothetical protein
MSPAATARRSSGPGPDAATVLLVVAQRGSGGRPARLPRILVMAGGRQFPAAHEVDAGKNQFHVTAPEPPSSL